MWSELTVFLFSCIIVIDNKENIMKLLTLIDHSTGYAGFYPLNLFGPELGNIHPCY